ncbi:MAG: hypothetical protein ACOY5B_18095 [Spirochaetota bacterium]
MPTEWQKFLLWNRRSHLALALIAAPALLLFAQDGTRPDATRRKTFAAGTAFLWHYAENLEQIREGNTTVIRLERKPDSASAADDLLIDFEHPALFRNPANQSLVLKQSLERTAVNDLSGKAAQFNLPGHQLKLRLPAYLHLSGNTGEGPAGNFSFSCELKPATAGGEILRRENFFQGRQYLLSVSLRNSRPVVRFENLLVATGSDGKDLLDSAELRSVDKLKQGERNSLLVSYSEATGRLELRVNGREQAVYVLKRNAQEHFALSFAPLKSAPLTLFSPYRGYADNVVFSNRVLGDEDLLHFGALKPYGDRYEQRSGLLLTEIFDLGYSQSSIVSVRADFEHDRENLLRVDFRCADRRFTAAESDSRLPFMAHDKAAGKKCRFVQFRARFTADNAGEKSPVLRKISIEYRENPPPAKPLAPKILSARDESLEIDIAPNTELDVVKGGRYIIYYGHTKMQPEGAFYFRQVNFGATTQAEPIAHKVPLRLVLNNEILAQNKKWSDAKPRFKNRYPVFEKGIGYYFWVTACDNAWSEAQEHADHCSEPSVPVFARFE